MRRFKFQPLQKRIVLDAEFADAIDDDSIYFEEVDTTVSSENIYSTSEVTEQNSEELALVANQLNSAQMQLQGTLYFDSVKDSHEVVDFQIFEESPKTTCIATLAMSGALQNEALQFYFQDKKGNLTKESEDKQYRINNTFIEVDRKEKTPLKKGDYSVIAKKEDGTFLKERSFTITPSKLHFASALERTNNPFIKILNFFKSK
jgi:hypothetical protein